MLDDKAPWFSTRHLLMLHVYSYRPSVLLRLSLHASESKRYYSLPTRKSVHGNVVTGQLNNFVPMSQADTIEDVDVSVHSNFSHAKTWQT